VTGTRRRPIVWRALLLGAVGAVLVTAQLYRPFVGFASFDHSQWMAGKSWNPNARQEMVRSLLLFGHLRGKSRTEAIALLGPPDGVGHVVRDDLTVSPSDAAGAAEFDYVLGVRMGAGHEGLALRFGADGRVTGWDSWPIPPRFLRSPPPPTLSPPHPRARSG
jgi:hypothetical protein